MDILIQGDPLAKEYPLYYEIYLRGNSSPWINWKCCGELLGLCFYFVGNFLGEPLGKTLNYILDKSSTYVLKTSMDYF